MRTTTLICTACCEPVKLSTKKATVWSEKAGVPFVCDDCIRKAIKAAALAAETAKADAVTRTFKSINLNPATYETRPNRTGFKRA